MAHTIVPSEELHALACEMADVDGLEYDEALAQAHEELEGLHQYAAAWDAETAAPVRHHIDLRDLLSQADGLLWVVSEAGMEPDGVEWTAQHDLIQSSNTDARNYGILLGLKLLLQHPDVLTAAATKLLAKLETHLQVQSADTHAGMPL